MKNEFDFDLIFNVCAGCCMWYCIQTLADVFVHLIFKRIKGMKGRENNA